LAIVSIWFAVPARGLERSEPDDIAGWIQKLGSNEYDEREAATRELGKLGPIVLAQLKKAAESPDMEVRRRAQELADRIEKQILTAKLLQPQRIRLVYKDVPVADAVADFGKKSGLLLQVGVDLPRGGQKAKSINRTITLDTGEVTLWEAYQQFCREAGLVEGDLLPKKRPSVTSSEYQVILREREIRIARQQFMIMDGNYQPPPKKPTYLFDGKVPELAVSTASSVRIRAVPPELLSFAPAKGNGEIQIVLDVTPEPKLTWRKLVDVRIEKAIDDRGQVLKVLPPTIRPTNNEGDTVGLIVVEDLINDPDGNGSSLGHATVRLRAGAQPSKMIQELQGTIAAQIQTPPEQLIAVSEVLKAKGKVVMGPDGASVSVVEATQGPDGQIDLRLEVKSPAISAANGAVFVRGGRVRFVQVGAGRMIVDAAKRSSGPSAFALVDAAGKKLEPKESENRSILKDGDLTQEYRLRFPAQKGQGEAATLIYTGPRNTVIDIPFTLRNIPVP
jgi:hypothetical protein